MYTYIYIYIYIYVCMRDLAELFPEIAPLIQVVVLWSGVGKWFVWRILIEVHITCDLKFSAVNRYISLSIVHMAE
jgi:hypothetical protein